MECWLGVRTWPPSHRRFAEHGPKEHDTRDLGLKPLCGPGRGACSHMLRCMAKSRAQLHDRENQAEKR